MSEEDVRAVECVPTNEYNPPSIKDQLQDKLKNAKKNVAIYEKALVELEKNPSITIVLDALKQY